MIIGILRPIIEIELFITFLKLTGRLPIKNYLFTIVINSILSSMPWLKRIRKSSVLSKLKEKVSYIMTKVTNNTSIINKIRDKLLEKQQKHYSMIITNNK